MLFFLLLIFWLMISSALDLSHLLTGSILVLAVVWFWQALRSRLPGGIYLGELVRLGHCLILLVIYIIQSNITVAKRVLFAPNPLDPVFVEMDTPLETNWGRVFLATCITLTPGTVTVDVNPDTGVFIVHALTGEIGRDLLYWRLIHRIRDLEIHEQRRLRHVVDVNRSDDTVALGTTKSDHRSHDH